MCREIKRRIARARMEAAGITQINKKRVWDDNYRKEKSGPNKGAWIGGWTSYFAKNWKKFLDPTTTEYKLAMSGRTRKRRGFLKARART